MYPSNPRQVHHKDPSQKISRFFLIFPPVLSTTSNRFIISKTPNDPNDVNNAVHRYQPTYVQATAPLHSERLPRHTTGSSQAPFCRSSCPTTTPRADDTKSGLHPCCTTSESAVRWPTSFDRCSLIRSNAKATYGRPTLVSWVEMWLLHGSCTWKGRGSGIGGLRKRW